MSGKGLRGSRAAFLAFILGIGACSGARAATPQQLEQAVKASFLFKFAPFVEWPAAAMGTPGKTFVICVGGEDPFGTTLDEVVRGQRLSGRPVAVRRLVEGSGIAGCNILFAGRGADQLNAIAGQATLTVSDRKTGPSGAMIQFVMQGGRVRFVIDNALARENGLTISSKLLGLAITVDGK